MAATSAVNGSRIGSIVPVLKNIQTSKVTELFKKVNWSLVFFMSVAVSYLFYHLYQWSQFNSHSALGLDEPFRLAKSRVLLGEAREKAATTNVEPLLQKCEALLASVTDRTYSFEKQPIALGLAQFYINANPDRACEIAQQFSSHFDMIKVAKEIQKTHPNFDQSKLNALWEKAFDAAVALDTKPSELKKWMEFFETFHAFGNPNFKDQALRKYLALASSLERGLERIGAWRQIAACYKEMGDIGLIKGGAISATDDLIVKEGLENSIPAHVHLAWMHFYAGNYEKMGEAFHKAVEIFNTAIPTIKAAAVSSLVLLVKALQESDETPSDFKTKGALAFLQEASASLSNFSGTITSDERVIFNLKIVDACLQVEEHKTAKNVLEIVERLVAQSADASQKASRYLTLASKYLDCKEAVLAQQASNQAFIEIQRMPESTDKEIRSKHQLLSELLQYCTSPEEAREPMQLYVSMYDKVSERKFSVGMTILQLYNENDFETESEAFFKQFLVDFKGSTDKPFEKIYLAANEIALVAAVPITSKKYVESPKGIAQIKKLLESAEALLPQVETSERQRAIRKLAEGYLLVDRQKAQELIEGVEDRQALRHLVSASVAAAALGAMYYYRADFVVPSIAAITLTML